MEKVAWDARRDGVIVKIGLGCERKEGGDTKMLFDGPRGIRLVFQRYSPGGVAV